MKRIDMRERIRDLLDDVRYALRGLARRPAFGAIAIVTLALRIGANTAIFSAIDALLLRALPFEKPDRLVDVTLLAPGEGDTQWSWGKAQVFLEAQRSYQSVALYATLGIVIDVPAAYAATGVLGAGLFNVSTTDPATYVAIVLLVSVAALVASWLPARVAVRVDPIIALRRN
ncbi:MAG: hypothetical protein ABJC26_03080 [Gemmatimonadaceae bacterium]